MGNGLNGVDTNKRTETVTMSHFFLSSFNSGANNGVKRKKRDLRAR